MADLTFKCPKGCGFIGHTRKEWIDHFKKKHPDVPTLRLGEEKINLEEA